MQRNKIRIIDCEISDNSEAGIKIGQDCDLEIIRSNVNNNGGHGADLSPNVNLTASLSSFKQNGGKGINISISEKDESDILQAFNSLSKNQQKDFRKIISNEKQETSTKISLLKIISPEIITKIAPYISIGANLSSLLIKLIGPKG